MSNVQTRYFSNINSFKGQNYGSVLPIKKSIADALTRTGKHERNLHRWANVEQVLVDGKLCDLYYYDASGIEIQFGSDL